MNRIQLMSEDLANKIAAGEVVERCMNVVKELVENAIDAQSSEIKIELVDSGVKEIKITDNGTGMSREDARLAFSRHATSKLKKLDDLFHIQTLGFRGEALPSIAAVSLTTLQTSDGSEGTLIEIDGGKMIREEASDLRKGTCITVRNLFYNTPVRLKYLKNLYSELSLISDYVNKMALSYPHVSFTLKNNGKLLLRTDGSDNLQKVIHAIYGLDIVKKMVPISGENDDYVISGYIGYPELMKGTRNAITILVNGRVIRNNEVNRILVDCYHTYMPPDKFPIVVLQIEVDPILIDVNIHPTKMDVKFSKMDTLKELITDVVSNTLKKLTLIPDGSRQIALDGATIKTETHYTTPFEQEFDSEKKEQEFADFEKMTLSLEVKESDISYGAKPDTTIDEIETWENRIKEMYPVGLVHGTYIVAENEDGMFLIDQHAANERINYEYYLKEMTKENPHKMDLLVPISMEFASNEYVILKEHWQKLEDLGFDVEEFGFQTIMIRSIPLWLRNTNQQAAIRQIIDIIIDREDFQKERFFHRIAATVACKASIKANDFITMEDMRVLLTRLRKCQNPFTCPHGRPTIITFSNYELERLFKRAM